MSPEGNKRTVGGKHWKISVDQDRDGSIERLRVDNNGVGPVDAWWVMGGVTFHFMAHRGARIAHTFDSPLPPGIVESWGASMVEGG